MRHRCINGRILFYRLLIVGTFFGSLSQNVIAQTYGHRFTTEWVSNSIVPISDGDYLLVSNGDSSPVGYSFVFQLLNSSFEPIAEKEYRVNGRHTGWTEPFTLKKYNNKSYISGYYEDNNGSSIGALFEIGVENENLSIDVVRKFEDYNYKTVLSDFYMLDSDTFDFFGWGWDTVNGKDRIRSWFKKATKDGVIIQREITTSGDESCCAIIKQVIESKDGYIIVMDSSTSQSPTEEVDPIILAIDSWGEVESRVNLGNDSQGRTNTKLQILGDGSFIGITSNSHWKMFQYPPGFNNVYPVRNKSSRAFHITGELDKPHEFSINKLPIWGNDGSVELYNQRWKTLSDGTSILLGWTYDVGVNSDILGFLVKLDRNGNFLWYRKIELLITKNQGKGRLKLYDFIEKSDNNLVLVGEYFANACDTFPNGIQTGVLVFVDKFGCTAPDCDLLGNSAVFNGGQRVVNVYPNPFRDEFTIEVEMAGLVRVYNFTGALIRVKEVEDIANIKLNRGTYFLEYTPVNSSEHHYVKLISN